MYIAAAIVIAMVLYLVDKNQKWSAFWRVVNWCAKVAVGCAVLFIADYYSPGRSVISGWTLVGILVVATIWELGGYLVKNHDKA